MGGDPSPTLVDLASFAATAQPGQVRGVDNLERDRYRRVQHLPQRWQ